jgi:heme/copper-type cytochrome/quinol oxidase subunit 2
MLTPARPEAASIARYWWLIFGVSLVVFVTVTTVLLYAVIRRRTAGMPLPLEPERERWTAVVMAATTALTLVTLGVLHVASILTGRAVDHDRDDADHDRAAPRTGLR